MDLLERQRWGNSPWLADQVQEHHSRMQDTTPAWMRLAQTWGLVLLIVAIVGGLIYLGAGMVIRPILQRVGIWIAPSVRTAAKLDAEAVAEDRASEAQHRIITARRTSEPDYNAAFEREHRRAKEERT